MERDYTGNTLMKGVIANSCVYHVDPSYDSDYLRDNDHYYWIPPTTNIMSYSNYSCRNEFTPMQIGQMWHFIEQDFVHFLRTNISNRNTPACTSGSSYTLLDIPGGTSNLQWSVTPTELIDPTTLSGTGATATIKAKNSSVIGEATIEWTSGSSCSYYNTTANIWVGKPLPTYEIFVASQQWNNQNQTCPNTILELATSDYSNYLGATSYYWSVQGASILSGQGTSSIMVKVPSHTGTRNLTFAVRAQNACGSSSWKTLYGTSSSSYYGCGGDDGEDGGGGMFTVISPNPNDGEFDLLFKDPEAMEDYYEGNGNAFRVTIMNMSGEEVFHGALNKNGLHINLKHAPKGIYSVRITGKDFEDTVRLLLE